MMEVMSVTLIIVIIEVLLSIRLYRMLTVSPEKAKT